MATHSLPRTSNQNLRPLFTNDGPTSGNPTIPALARGVLADTMIAFSNKNLSHVCDFVDEMRKNVALKEFLKAVADKLREGIRKIMAALGVSDLSGMLAKYVDQLKTATRWLKRIQKEILEPILDFQKYVLAYITNIRAIIQWILGLPAKFLAVLRDCLTRLLLLVKNVFSDFFEVLFDGVDTGLGDAIKAGQEFAEEAYRTVNLTAQIAVGAVTIVSAVTVGLLNPVSEAELIDANRTIDTYASKLPTVESIAASTAPEDQKKSAP
jgi:hypothetical protein